MSPIRVLLAVALFVTVSAALAAPVAAPATAPGAAVHRQAPGVHGGRPTCRSLEAHGFQVDAAAWDSVTPDLLRHYNAVIITGFWGEYASGNNVEAGVKSGFSGLRPRYLAEYIKAGGGVLVALNSMGAYGEGRLGEVPDWLKQFDCNFWVEAITDPARQVLASPPSIRRYNTMMAWTDDLAKHPITAGAKKPVVPDRLGRARGLLVGGRWTAGTSGHRSSAPGRRPSRPGRIPSGPTCGARLLRAGAVQPAVGAGRQ